MPMLYVHYQRVQAVNNTVAALAISHTFLLHILLHVRSRPHPFAPIYGQARPAHLIENMQNQGLLLDLKTARVTGPLALPG